MDIDLECRTVEVSPNGHSGVIVKAVDANANHLTSNIDLAEFIAACSESECKALLDAIGQALCERHFGLVEQE